MKVRLSEFNPEWKKQYQEECTLLKSILGTEILRFEHFGSTAIEGMKAKPVIDIMVIVKDIQVIDHYQKILEDAAYDYAEEWGIIGRRLLRKGGDNRSHHIHIYQVSNVKEIERHLMLRDYLRIKGNEVRDYSKFKEKLSNQFEDTCDYSKAKKDYVQKLEKRAMKYFEKQKNMNPIIKEANSSQADLLSKIAFESKKYWGYSDEFMEKCREDLTVTADYIENNLVKVIYSNQLVAGFYAFDIKMMMLDALFVSPSFIDKKIGILLWNDLIDELKDRQINKFTFDSEPNAVGFYKKMGAVQVGETISSVDKTRRLPFMECEVIR